MMKNIGDERREALAQYAVDLACGNVGVCTFHLRNRYFTPSDSPDQYIINFNILFEFIFTRRTQHPTTWSHVSARVAVPLADETRHRVCHEKTRAAIVEALDEAYLPHFPRERDDDLVAFAWKEAWEGGGVMTNLPPRGGYKDLNLDLLVTVRNPFVWVFDPSEGMLFDKNNFCYACAVEIILMYEEETNNVSCCGICLEDFASTVQGWRFPCKHVFHGDCIQKWLTIRRDCPVCQCQLR